MAVPLTSDLPGTSKEAGGTSIFRFELRRAAASLHGETSFQVADTRKPCQYTFVRVDAKVVKLPRCVRGRARAPLDPVHARNQKRRSRGFDRRGDSIRGLYEYDQRTDRSTRTGGSFTFVRTFRRVREHEEQRARDSVRCSSGAPGDFDAGQDGDERKRKTRPAVSCATIRSVCDLLRSLRRGSLTTLVTTCNISVGTCRRNGRGNGNRNAGAATVRRASRFPVDHAAGHGSMRRRSLVITARRSAV